MKLKRLPLKDGFINLYENNKIAFGFTEINTTLTDLQVFFNNTNFVELKQIHSNNILFSSQINPGSRGDGILLDQKKIIAIIKTADCVPLFFWSQAQTIGGLAHIGWRGLLQGIEKKIVSLLTKNTSDLETLRFHLGPSIEKKCYEVGQDLYNTFKSKSFRGKIFFYQGNGKYLMDIKKGIILSLKTSGISAKNISYSTNCTFCENQRFPSNRRSKDTLDRIYNFFLLK